CFPMKSNKKNRSSKDRKVMKNDCSERKAETSFRSEFEKRVAFYLEEAGCEYAYEACTLEYTEPAKKHRYTPDFCLPNGVLVEVKGRWTPEDRKKHLLLKAQYPDLDIRMVFSNPREKINKGSTTTYADYCERHGIIFAKGHVPSEWFLKSDEKSVPVRNGKKKPQVTAKHQIETENAIYM
ncbi:MAG: hypothetical protein PHG30_09475, partial [Eubacteriales bacterium]|nr:hypothetical protein [Eubacteriales bacterium]